MNSGIGACTVQVMFYEFGYWLLCSPRVPDRRSHLKKRCFPLQVIYATEVGFLGFYCGGLSIVSEGG
jgi:hypothetical protein